MNEMSSGVYVIDAQYNIVSFNRTAGILFPQLVQGKKCHKCLMNADEPCPICPVANGVKGPKTYLDPIRHVYESVNAVEVPVEGHGLCHALVFSTLGEQDDALSGSAMDESKLHQLGVIQALAADYEDLYGWNVVTGKVDVYRFTGNADGVRDQLEGGMGYEGAMRAYIQRNVHPEDRVRMWQMTQPEVIRQALENSRIYLVHYRVLRGGEVHHFCMKCVRVGESGPLQDLVLGFANEDEAVRREQAQRLQMPGNPDARRKILIVDAKEENRDILSSILKRDYDLLMTDNAREGFTLLEEHYRELSLILLNIRLNGESGIELLRRARADALLASVPVMITTTDNTLEEEELCLQLGAADFVSAPYTPNVVMRRVQSLIHLSESSAALHAIEFDDLTGLYTRRAFFHHAQQMLRRNPEVRYDMFISDIEDFKRVNERYGEAVGDALLRHMGKYLGSVDREEFISCRYAADQYVAIMRHIDGMDVSALEYFGKVIYEKAPIRDYVVKYGIYDDVAHDLPVSVLCDRLLIALNTVKHRFGPLAARYDLKMQRQVERERAIESSMEQALEQRQFQVYYQPKHDARTGAVSGAEALVRWIHPRYGFLSPGDFIPIFEHNGFITKLDLYVWKQVCRDLRRWQDDGLKVVPISVNASRRDFVVIRDLAQLEQPVQENGLDKRLLHIEVTESLYMEDPRKMLPKAEELREAGFQVEMDDFGSGYSSLGLIKKLPIDIIKLDISFVRELEEQREVVEVIIGLAHSLGLKIVAEGVETLEQLETLQAMGCDYVQGYYYSRPLPREGFEAYLSQWAE